MHQSGSEDTALLSHRREDREVVGVVHSFVAYHILATVVVLDFVGLKVAVCMTVDVPIAEDAVTGLVDLD